MTKPKIGDRKLEKEWDDETAAYEYRLLEYRKNFYFFPYLADPKDRADKYGWNWVESGNKAWATRIAKHYKLDLPK